jgi:oligopeptide/dipeptide ABC transporter ATP-binding protein
MAVMLVTHDLAIATSFCGNINVMYAGRIVEGGPAEALRRRPAHPYSAALLKSICDTSADVDRPLPSITGTPPGSAHDFPGGCAFHPRCPVAVEICSRAQPAPVAVGTDRVAECHLAGAVAAADVEVFQ